MASMYVCCRYRRSISSGATSSVRVMIHHRLPTGSRTRPTRSPHGISVMSVTEVGFVPAGVVHRETTGPEGPGEAFVLRVGTGPQNVNVDGPDPA